MKVVVSDAKTGASWQRELEKSQEIQLYGRRIGDAFDGGLVGLEGYSLKITGGSDRDGTPMRAEIQGAGRVRALLGEPPGVRRLRKGEKRRKLVRGNTISAEIVQVNAVIASYGPKSLEELGFVAKAKAEEAKEGEAKESKPASRPEAKGEDEPKGGEEAKGEARG